MRRLIATMLAASAALAVAAPAAAQTTIAVTGGTLGVGPEVTYGVGPVLSVRGSATWLGVSGHGSTGGYRYDGHVHLATWGGTVDVHPFMNGFRISGGARSTSSEHVDFVGEAETGRTYGGQFFTPDQLGTASGRIRVASVSPIATLGWSGRVAGPVVLGFDAGAMFHGRPDVEYVNYTGELATNPIAQADRAAQEQTLQDRVSRYRVHPIAQLSLGLRF